MCARSSACYISTVVFHQSYICTHITNYSTQSMFDKCLTMNFDCDYFYEIEYCRAVKCATRLICDGRIESPELCMLKHQLCSDFRCQPNPSRAMINNYSANTNYKMYDLCCNLYDHS